MPLHPGIHRAPPRVTLSYGQVSSGLQPRTHLSKASGVSLLKAVESYKVLQSWPGRSQCHPCIQPAYCLASGCPRSGQHPIISLSPLAEEA